jgi:predicted aspartyl protease
VNKLLFILIAILSAAAAPASAAAPRTPAEILTDAARAHHAAQFGGIGGISASGQEHAFGLTARWTEDVDVGRRLFSTHADFGLFAIGSVYDGRTEWRIDRSGAVHPLDGRFAAAEAVTEAWLRAFGYLKPGAARYVTAAMGRRQRDGAAYDVIELTPPGGRPVQLWFGASSHLLQYAVRRRPLRTETIHYSDFRRWHGLVLPFREESGAEPGGNGEEVTIDRYRILRPASAGLFRRPRQPRDTVLRGPTTVPIENEAYVVVSAMLNGRGPFDFILDTGGHNILTPAVARQLGLEVAGEGRSGGAGAGTLAESDTRVRELRIGAASMRDQHFYVIPLQYGTVERGRRPPLAGILGLELFERLRVTIDYRSRRLTLRPPDSLWCPGTAVPIAFDDDMPLVAGAIDGRPGVLAIDSGNAGSTVVQGVWAARNGLAERMRRGIRTVSFGAGGQSTNWIMRGGSVALGGIRVENVDLRLAQDTQGAFSSISEAGNVGQQVLARFAVTFDYAGARMCLAPVPGYVAPPLNRSGLILMKRDPATLEVVSVIEGSPAAEAGMRQGDVVESLGGHDAETLSGIEALAILRQAPGTQVPIRLRRGSSLMALTLRLKDPEPPSAPSP